MFNRSQLTKEASCEAGSWLILFIVNNTRTLVSYLNVHKFNDAVNLAIVVFLMFLLKLVHAKPANVWLVELINSYKSLNFICANFITI